MNLLYRRTRGLAGLAIFTVIALVGCGQATGTKAVDLKPIPDVESLKVGSTHTVSLIGTFSGENLTYSPKSSNTAVATAKVDGVHLTVTGIGAGKATITVTATDAQNRSVKDEFTVTVVKPTTSEPAPGAPTVGQDATDEVNVDQDDTHRIILSSVFDGDDLEYDTPSSSRPAVATASVSNGILTISALSPGTTTITIVATNDDGNATHRIAVTVPDPEPPGPTTPEPPSTNNPSDCPSPLPSTGGLFKVTLKITRGLSGNCTLPADHYSLIYEHSAAAVSVKKQDDIKTTNVWTIEAEKKGRPVVYIHNDNTGETAGDITVVVPNTPPRWKSDPVDAVTFFADPTTGTTTDDINLQQYFEDDDEEDTTPPAGKNNIFRYRVVGKPAGVLIDVDQGFVKVTDGGDANAPTIAMEAVVLKRPDGATFPIQLRAYDKDNAPSNNAVTVKFTTVSPQSGMYAVNQNDDTGNFETVRLGNRVDVDHTLTFAGSFEFSELDSDKYLKIVDKHRVLATLNPDDAEECTGGAPGNWGQGTDVGVHCYSITPSTGVVIQPATELATPSVVFQLSSKSGTASRSITIRYHVWALNTGVPAGDVAAATGRRGLVTYPRTLRLNVHTCVKTTDCP